MLAIALLSLLAAAAQATSQTPSQPATQAPAAPPRTVSQTPAQAPPAAPRPTTITIKVLDRSGSPLANAVVTFDGPSSRQGTTKPDGTLAVQNAVPGTYRARIERSGYITLEKEIQVRSGTPVTAEAALSAAPPPPPPPEPPPPVIVQTPVPAAPLPAGSPRVVDVTDLAEHLIKDAVAQSALGCSGGAAAKLMNLRDTLAASANPDVDQMLYVVAGDGMLKLGDKDQAVSAGWFSLVPRGSSYTLTRKGRTLIVLSIASGTEPCPASASSSAKK